MPTVPWFGVIRTFKIMRSSHTATSKTPRRPFNLSKLTLPRPSNPHRASKNYCAESGTTAFLIVQDDQILYEKYFNGFERDSWFTSFSVAKSFDSALIGMAIAEGLIGSVDDPVVTYIPELSGRGLDDLTIRNLLKMDCGVSYVSRSEGLLGGQSDDSRTYYMPDLRAPGADRPTQQGSRSASCFHYNNYYPILEGMILERVTGMTVSQYLQERIWKPLGMEYPATWSINQDGDGLEKMESGINARAIDYAKFGRLYLNKGSWDGTQILPRGLGGRFHRP